MTREIDNALLLHGEQDSIPFPSINKLVRDAHQIDTDELLDNKDAQIAALEEANQALAKQIDVLLLEKRALEDRAMGKEYD